MRKNILLYTVALTLLFIIFLFFNRIYQGLKEYSQLTGSAVTINSTFQDISRQIKNAFALDPDLIKAGNSSKADKLFFIDSQSVIRQLNVLKTIVQDPVSVGITKELDAKVRSQLSWIIDSNVPDSIIGHKAPAHIASLISIDSLIGQGIQRNNFLLDGHKQQLYDTIDKMKSWMFLFIAFSGILLIYAISNLSKKNLKRKRKEIAGNQDALDESAIVAVTGRKGIMTDVNDNFCNISKLKHDELIGGDPGLINPEFHPKESIRNLWVINSSEDAILSKTLEGIITSWNHGAEKIFGYTPGEIIGKHISILIPAHLRDEEKKIIEKISKGEDLAHYETERIRKDGNVIYVSLTISPVKDPAGNITGASKIVRDITNQKKTEQKVVNALKEKETVLNRISDGVVSVDNDWRYTFLNDAALVTHPMSKEETLGKNIWDVHPGMKGTIFWDKYHEAMDTGKVVEIDDYYAPMNIWFSVKVYPSVDGLTIFYKDVTESKRAEQKLSKTLKEVVDYKFALDEAAIVAITDQKGIILHANDNFCKISKYSEEELIGQDHRIINSGHHPKEFIRNLWVTIANGEIWKGELKNKAKDGSIYWVDTTIVPFLTEEGKPYQYVAIRADITERKRVEDELASSEIHFRSLIENSIEGISLTDEFSKIFYRSPGAERIIGLLPKDTLTSFTHPDDRELIKNKFADAVRNPKVPVLFQSRHLHPSGHYIWLEGTFTNMLHISGVNAIVSNFRDITFRKEAEDKLIKSEKIYKTIASGIPGSVICLLDTDYRYFLIEGDMLKKLGYSKDKLLGNKAEDVWPREIFASIKSDFKRVLGGETITRESRDHGYDIISRFIPLKDENNMVYAIMTVAMDVTQLKNAQRGITELNRGLEEKIIQRTEQLRKTNIELEGFSYSVSHDLRAPLRIINGFGQILIEDYAEKLDKEGQHVIGVIMNNAKKMGQLIDDLLSFSKLGRSEMRMSKVNMNDLVTEVLQELKASGIFVPAGLRQNELAPAKGDRNLLKQVWVNLISNAIKYSSSRKDPLIEIGTTEKEDKLIYYVKDNGAGFDMQYANKLFGVFQRLHKAEEFEGTGVGLALVQRIILRHDGAIWAEAEENKGATFYFTLPG